MPEHHDPASIQQDDEPTGSQPGSHTPLPIRRQSFNSPPGLALRQFIRRNLLIVVATAIFISATVLVLEQIDKVYYQREKKEVIQDLINRQRLFGGTEKKIVNDLTDEYTALFLSKARPVGPDDKARTREELEQIARIQKAEADNRAEKIRKIEAAVAEAFRKHPYIYRFTFADIDNNILLNVEDPTRRVAQNDWSNSLFIHDYTVQFATIKFRDVLVDGTTVNQPVAVTSFYLTTPKNVPEIRQLTQKWRIRSGIILLFIFIFYGFILSGLLLPVRNVIMALDKGAAIGSPLIDKPRTVLEKYYNNLARDATLSIFSTALRDFTTARKLVEHTPMMEYAPKLITSLFPVRDAQVWNLRFEPANAHWVFESILSGVGEPQNDFKGIMLRRLSDVSPIEHPEKWESPMLDYYDEDQRLAHWLPSIIISGNNTVSLLVVHLSALKHGSSGWWERLVNSIGRELRFALRAISEQRRLIIQEKSKANITLSRNIGHDLTNIIATSKLELMNVKTLLEMPREEVYASPVRQRIFKESLEALLNNTRFLQETVNLYRSFTYLSRPKFEVINLNELVADVCALFKLSLSRSIEIHLELAQGIELVELEPRLLRLAMFNLLSNASDSIKRVSEERPQGRIIVRTAPGRANEGPVIEVEDNGGGIRDREGRLLEPHEIAGIFQLGYSTKEKESGEGLGLNWVQQIVQEFHGGELSAHNITTGGAVFVIRLAPSHRPATAARPSPEEHHDQSTDR